MDTTGVSPYSLTLQGDWSNAHRGDTLTATNTLSIISGSNFDIYVKSSTSSGQMATGTSKTLSNDLIASITGYGHSGSGSVPGTTDPNHLSSSPYKILSGEKKTYTGKTPASKEYPITYTQVISSTDPFCTGTAPDIYTIVITWGFTASI